MSLYLKQIEQLISLQKVDDEIFVVRQELENAPKERDAMKAKTAELEETRTRRQERFAHLKEQEKRLGFEMEDEAGRLKKSKSKLMTAGNSKEYQAMVREMDSMERIGRDREEEKTALAEELARSTAALEEVEAEYQAAETALAACEAGLADRVGKAETALAALLQRRGSTGKEVPIPVFDRYEFIRERLEHPVIVPVNEGVCAGCNISIPPQNFIELQKAAQILSCPNCQRLMYWDRHFSPAEEQ